MRRLVISLLPIVALCGLGWWSLDTNWDVVVPDDIPESATIALTFDRIEGDVDATVLPQWLAAAAVDVRLGYQARLLVWPFTSELKMDWSGYLPIFTLGFAPRTFWRQVKAEDVQVSHHALSLRVSEVWAGLLYLKEVDLGADLPTPGMGLPPEPWRLNLKVRPWHADDAERLSSQSHERLVERHTTFVAHGVLQAQGMHVVPDWSRWPELSQADGTPYRSPLVPHPHSWFLLGNFGNALVHDHDGIERAIDDRKIHREWSSKQEEVRQDKQPACPCDADRYPYSEVKRIRQALQAAATLLESSSELRPYTVSGLPHFGHVTTAKRKGQLLQLAHVESILHATDPPAKEGVSGVSACHDGTTGRFFFVDGQLIGFSGKVVQCAKRREPETLTILWDEQGRLASYTEGSGEFFGKRENAEKLVHEPDKDLVARVRAASQQAATLLPMALPDPSGPW